MIEDLILNSFPKKAGVYIFKVNNEVIYIGSSKNLYQRMAKHRSNIRKGGNHNGTSKQELYQFLQSNTFIVEIQLDADYRQLEQKLIEQYHPKYNILRANTGLGAKKGREAEYGRERYQKYKEEILDQKKQYHNQLCLFNGEILTLSALSMRFKRKCIDHPTLEAKKYLIL